MSPLYPLLPCRTRYCQTRGLVHGRLQTKLTDKAFAPVLGALEQEARELLRLEKEREQQRQKGMGCSEGQDGEDEVEGGERDKVEAGSVGDGMEGIEEQAAPPQVRITRTYPKTPAPLRTYTANRSHLGLQGLSSNEPNGATTLPNQPSTSPVDVLFAIERTCQRLERLGQQERETAAFEHDSRAIIPPRPRTRPSQATPP